MGRRFGTIGVVLALCAVGCDTAPVSPGPDAGGGVTAPALAAAPVLTPCPPGWRETGSDPVVCDPWPAEGRRVDCAFDEAHFPGTPGCARIGTACAVDGWPSDLPTGATVTYVDGAATSGDGTQAHPFPRIAQALTAASPGAIVAIHVGTYDEDLILDRGITLWGACVNGTRLTSSRVTDGEAAVVEIHGPGTVRNVGIDHPLRYGLLTRGGGADVEDVVVVGARTEGLWTESGTAEVHRAVFRESQPTSDGSFGRGIEASTDTSPDNLPHVTLDHVVIDETRDIAVFAVGGAVIEGHDIAITRTQLGIQTGLAYAVVADNAGTRIALTRVVIEETDGDAISPADHASVELTDVVIRDGLSAVSIDTAVAVQFAGTATLSRAWVHDIGLGFGTAGAGSTLTATDVVLSDLNGGDTLRGRGVGVQTGSTQHLTRARIQHVRADAVIVSAVGSTATLEDVVIRDVASDVDGRRGYGVTVEEDATITLSRVWIDQAREVGLFATVRGRIDGQDVRITDVLANGEGTFGAGTIAQDHATISLTRAEIARVLIVSAGSVVESSMTLTDVSVADARPGCFDPGCTMPVGGYGLAAYRGSTLTVTRFDVTRTELCGVMVGDDEPPAITAVDLSHGAISHSAVGACLQVPGYDPERLHDDVRYVDVGVPLQATSYMLPTELGGL